MEAATDRPMRAFNISKVSSFLCAKFGAFGEMCTVGCYVLVKYLTAFVSCVLRLRLVHVANN